MQLIERLEGRTFFAVTPNDPLFSQEWWLQQVSAPQAWDITTGSTGVIVNVNDTGIDYTHPDLYLNIWLNQKEIPFAVGTKSNTLRDTDADGLITFWDLNATDAKGSRVNASFTRDVNRNGYIDAGDLLNDPRWEDGSDRERNGYVDDLIGWDFINNDNDPFDDAVHGTFVAGVIGTIGDNAVGGAGVCWRTQMMATKHMNPGATVFESGGPISAGAAGLIYAVDNGARISNNSWGYFDDEEETPTVGDVVYNAIDYARRKGVLSVSTAGNLNWDVDRTGPDQPYPSAFDLPNIIVVAGTNSNDEKWSDSGYGRRSVDLAAPAEAVGSTVPVSLSPSFPYGLWEGTSFAAPHVAGAAALMLSVNPNLNYAQLKDMLIKTADPLASFKNKTVSGGRLNVFRAVTAAASAPGGSSSSSSSTAAAAIALSTRATGNSSPADDLLATAAAVLN